MIRINDNGELVKVIYQSDGKEGTIEYESVIVTAAELKAAYAEKGMVVVTFDDADSLRCYYAEEAENTIKPGRKEWLLEQSKRLEAAIKEAP